MDYFYLYIKDDDRLIATRALNRDEFNTIEGDGAQFIINAYSKFFNLDISDYNISRLILDESPMTTNLNQMKILCQLKIA